MNELTDIVAGCMMNNRESQRELYNRYYGFALKIGFRYLFIYDKAVDVVNGGFKKVFILVSQFKDKEKEDAEKTITDLIRRAMINSAIKELRLHKQSYETAYLPDTVWGKKDNITHTEELFYKELMKQIGGLSLICRTVFNMSVIDRFSHNEIAQILDVSKKVSESNLETARNLLRKYLDENTGERIVRK